MRADDLELGRDQLDAALGPGERRWWSLPRRRPALGVASLGPPALLYVAVGVALGPAGVDLFSGAALHDAQTIAWIALAVLGVFIGLGLHGDSSLAPGPTLIAGSVIAAITVAAIATGMFLEVSRVQLSRADAFASPTLASCLLIGLCAAVSGALHTREQAPAELRAAARLADVDDVPLVWAGTVLIGICGGGPIWWRLAATLLGGAAIGCAGWLLFDRADGAERGLYVAGAVLLLAGIGAYLGTSPLLAGWSAATLWLRLPGAADRITARDLRPLQHPLVALLLIMAGALIRWNAIILWVTAFLVVLRIAAKLLATLATCRYTRIPPAMLASVLLYPGVMGIALATNARLVLGDDFDWVVSTVTIATVVAEVIAAFLPDVEREAA